MSDSRLILQQLENRHGRPQLFLHNSHFQALAFERLAPLNSCHIDAVWINRFPMDAGPFTYLVASLVRRGYLVYDCCWRPVLAPVAQSTDNWLNYGVTVRMTPIKMDASY